MNRVCTNAAEAMKVAFALSTLLGRPVRRCMGVGSRGVTVWVVSLDSNSQNALQELTV